MHEHPGTQLARLNRKHATHVNTYNSVCILLACARVRANVSVCSIDATWRVKECPRAPAPVQMCAEGTGLRPHPVSPPCLPSGTGPSLALSGREEDSAAITSQRVGHLCRECLAEVVHELALVIHEVEHDGVVQLGPSRAGMSGMESAGSLGRFGIEYVKQSE